MKNLTILATVLTLLWAVASAAETPCGAALCRSELTADQVRQSLDFVARARVANQQTFDDLARIRASVPELDAAKRGRLAIIGPYLLNLGDGAAAAILERLAIRDEGPAELSPTALDAWRVGLLDALGKLRDNRAEAVLEAICRNPNIEPLTLTTAAAALGRLESDLAASVLVELSTLPGPRGRAVLAGMGHCRRLVVVRRLAEALPVQQSCAAHRDVARSLATAASSLVWRAGLTSHLDEELEIRSAASRALLDDYVTRSGAHQATLVTALMVVDDPATLELIEARRKNAGPALREALDVLERRLETNPVSRMAVPERVQ